MSAVNPALTGSGEGAIGVHVVEGLPDPEYEDIDKYNYGGRQESYEKMRSVQIMPTKNTPNNNHSRKSPVYDYAAI